VKKLLLLVEDEPDIREQLRELFEDEGFAVIEARNGLEALNALERGLCPDMVFMDLMMPVMDGWELLASMQRNKRLAALPVMVASAMEDGTRVPKGVPFVRKPFSVVKLLNAVHAQTHCLPARTAACAHTFVQSPPWGP
jgi:CheY-like chemotaxis protein